MIKHRIYLNLEVPGQPTPEHWELDKKFKFRLNVQDKVHIWIVDKVIIPLDEFSTIFDLFVSLRIDLYYPIETQREALSSMGFTRIS